MFGFFDTVDSLVGDLSKTAKKLANLAEQKATEAAYYQAFANRSDAESERAARVSAKIDALIS